MKFFKIFKEAKNNLTNIGNKEPLNWFSIFILIVLDIFVITNLFYGLDIQTKQIDRPDEKVPYQCRELVDTDYDNKISKIEIWNNYSESSFYYRNDFYKTVNLGQKKNERIIPECKKVYSAILKVSSDTEVERDLDKISSIRNKIWSLKNENNIRRREYDTNLLEKIAGQEDDKSLTVSNADRVKSEINENNRKIKELEREEKGIEDRVLYYSSVKNAERVISENKAEILSKYQSASFWYSIKVLGLGLLYLLPLFFIFWFLYSRASKKGSSIYTLIYSHLLLIAAIPIIWNVFAFIFEIIPKKFLAKFLELLEILNIGSLLYYILIFVGIGIGILLIYIVQKKLFNVQKTRLKRIQKGECPYCGMRVNHKDNFCYNCGEQLKVKCQKCGNTTHKDGLYCEFCGSGEFKN